MIITKLLRLIAGLFIYALGIVFTIKANLGVAAWDTFHIGISEQSGISLGNVMILTGLAIVVFNIFSKENMGIGTILNMWLIGVFVDFLMENNWIAVSQSSIGGLFKLCFAMVLIAIATWLYVGAGYGSGPRDGLMITLVKWTGKPVGFVRMSIELTVLIIGFFLGGPVGIGTPIAALLIGPICQWTFKILKFDIKSVEHTYIDWNVLKNLSNSSSKLD